MASGLYMTEELIVENLVKLPVKSLLRFRCISKSWYSMITYPGFIAKHLDHNKEEENGRLCVFNCDFDARRCAFAVYPDKTLTVPLFEYIGGLKLKYLAHVLGPCNGIFCLINPHHRQALWNPAIREFRNLPPRTISDDIHYTSKGEVFGFGFDPFTNDYKYRDGVYYWCGEDKNELPIYLSFDMADEVFRMIPEKHSAPNREASYYWHLDEYVQRLLKEGEEKDDEYYWRKEVVAVGPFAGAVYPLGFWKRGELIVGDRDNRLFLADPNTLEMKDLGNVAFQAFVYHESFVSVKRSSNQESDNLSDAQHDLLTFDIRHWKTFIDGEWRAVREDQSVITGKPSMECVSKDLRVKGEDAKWRQVCECRRPSGGGVSYPSHYQGERQDSSSQPLAR
ncbi:hypothetical protein Acr_00g0013690 [Actinidia rufa]|uniref:F-box domain-containing protein n=1 Tax=Actinidia rufa TaxID=165716 RepID=A0A7J0DA38_9ERIC|nr:hypothetical protein Acr_00g0013690 [Actinidia rufa]